MSRCPAATTENLVQQRRKNVQHLYNIRVHSAHFPCEIYKNLPEYNRPQTVVKQCKPHNSLIVSPNASTLQLYMIGVGLITNPATNDEYSLVHIEARHGGKIRKTGYKSVLEFIEHVAKNYECIREGNVRNDNPTYMLQLKDKHNNTLIVELSLDGNYWNINTVGIFKDSYGKNRKEVYRRHTTAKQPAETVGTSQEVEQSGTQTSSSMNVPTSSQNDAALQTAAFQPHGDNTNSSESKDRGKNLQLQAS